jgi:hypothetical protein
MIAPPRGEASTAAPRRPLAPCCGHAFNEDLRCRCHASWWAHQRRPEPCPVDARRRNSQLHEISEADHHPV